MENKKGKILKGVIVSTKMAKTIVVEVPRLIRHPKYGKYLKRSHRFLVHDEQGGRRLGEKVSIRETRPRSRHKHFEVIQMIRNGNK